MAADRRHYALGRTQAIRACLVIRIPGDAVGRVGPLVMHAFEVVDSVMAIRRLWRIRAQAERFGAHLVDPTAPETWARDQFQLYETIWTTGRRAWSGLSWG